MYDAGEAEKGVIDFKGAKITLDAGVFMRAACRIILV